MARQTTAAFLLGAALLLGLAPAGKLFAQFTSSVQGTVTDSSGSLVPGAAVALMNDATAVTYQTTTNGAGQYRFLSLPAGHYTLDVNQSGFAEVKRAAVVTAEEAVGLDISLSVATAGTKVTVTDQAPLLNPDETRQQYTLEADELSKLPAQNHGTLNFIKLAPGNTGIDEDSSDIQPNRNLADASANGLSNASNLYTLDGVPINSVLNYASAYEGQINGAVIFTPNVDSLGEVSLQTTTFNVNYGNAASMQVGLSTKSGSNTFHGVGDYTYNDKVLNASAYEQPNVNANHKAIYSGALGGPIWKNHTFFFGAFEHLGSYGAGSSSSQWWTPEFQSFIAKADPNSVNVQKFMLGNPATRLIPDGKGINTGAMVFGNACGTPAAFNVPCSLAVTQEGVAATPFILNGKNWNVRGDQYLNNDRDRVFLYYFSVDQTSNSASPNPTWDGETPTFGRDFTTNYTHTFSSSLLNSATFGYTYFNFQFSDTPHSSNLLEVPFLTQIFDAGSISGFTRFVPFGNEERQFYGRDALLWTKGKHSIDFGLEAANNYATNVNYVYARPFINQYFSTLDFLKDKLDGELVLSHYNASSGAFEPFIGNGEVTRLGLYAQDSWKVTSHLTINYGLRWDDLGNPSPYGKSIPWSNSLFSGSNDGQIASDIVSRQVKHAFSSARNTVSPRAGFAWSPFADRHGLVFRGGVGLYQDLINLENIATTLTSNSPTGAVGTFFGASQAVLSYGSNAATPPYGFTFPAVQTGSFRADGSPSGSAVGLSGYDPNLKIPRTAIWNFAVEKALPGSAVVSAAYSGSHSYDLGYQTDLNRPAGSDYCGTPGNLPNPLTCTSPVSHPVNKNWSSITPYRSGLISNYDALIVQYRQKWRGLTMQTSYTWSHSLDDASGLGAANSSSQVLLQYDPGAQYGNSDFDVRHRLTASFVYQFPTPAGNSLAKLLLGGWSLNGDVIAQTGQPFTVYYNDPAHDYTGSGGNGNFYAIPNYTGTQRSGWSKQQLYNGLFAGQDLATLFSLPGCVNCVGSAGRNQFWGPNYVTWDQSFVKLIKLPWFQGESSTLSLRAQAFNLLNRVNFSNLPTDSRNNINAGNFALTAGAYQGRVIQVGARFEF